MDLGLLHHFDKYGQLIESVYWNSYIILLYIYLPEQP